MLSEINWHFKTPLPTHISTTLVPNLSFNLAKGKRSPWESKKAKRQKKKKGKGKGITMGERGDLGETQEEE